MDKAERKARREKLAEQRKKRPPHSTPWTLDEALVLIREVAPMLKAYCWGVGLTGSILVNGKSDNDLDIIVYPYDDGWVDRSLVAKALECVGWWLQHDTIAVHRAWRRRESQDCKHVEIWRAPGDKRVDVFFLR